MSGGRIHGGIADDLWDDEDGFFYDVLHTPDDRRMPPGSARRRTDSAALAVQTLEPDLLEQLPELPAPARVVIQNRLTCNNVASMDEPGHGKRRLLAIVDDERLRRVLSVMLDEREFLSPYGIRGLSQAHRDRPYRLGVDGSEYRVAYEPGESSTALFGGNSNWRGPVWFPINYLLIEALQKFHHYYGDTFTIECPTGSGRMLTLWEVAAELSRRLARIFLTGEDGRRPVYGAQEPFQSDPHWRDLILFFEYFHGDTGADWARAIRRVDRARRQAVAAERRGRDPGIARSREMLHSGALEGAPHDVPFTRTRRWFPICLSRRVGPDRRPL